MAIRYANKGTLFKALYYTEPYLSVIFRSRFFWDTPVSCRAEREYAQDGDLARLFETIIYLFFDKNIIFYFIVSWKPSANNKKC